VTRYTADSRDRVRDAVDMVALVESRGIELSRKAPNSYFGRCPFHDERTASFHVSPDERLYHCFGCGEAGDAFKFVMETEGVDFKGALESLAQRFGVELQTEDEDPAAAQRRRRRERLYSLLDRAATFYARYLWDGAEAASAREYLLGRGLTEQTLREFRVGYAPKAWDRMLLASRRAGYTEEELVAAGLAQRSHAKPGQVYDRFRERIMFPSADARGRVLGFGARAMRDSQPPKYLNTSENELYHKRRQLFGIDRARASAAKAGRAILVEGYTDVLALHQAGITNAVGIMGTKLTEEQLGELERVANVLELCLDFDEPGQQAMLRAATIAAGRRLELRVVPLPPGRDPADLIAAEGADALRERVRTSVPFVVFHVGRILDAADTGSAEGRDRALAELSPVLAEVPPSVLREDLVRRIAGRLELSEARLHALAAGAAGGAGQSGANGASGATATARGMPPTSGRAGAGSEPRPAVATPDAEVRAERAFLVLCVALPSQGRAALELIDPEQHLTSAVFRRAARHLRGRTAMPLTDLPPDDDELARVIADLVKRSGQARDVRPENLEHTRLVLELARLDRAVRRARAERSGDVAAVAREREAVRRQIGELVSRLEDPV
jgi:DNA primase